MAASSTATISATVRTAVRGTAGPDGVADDTETTEAGIGVNFLGLPLILRERCRQHRCEQKRRRHSNGDIIHDNNRNLFRRQD